MTHATDTTAQLQHPFPCKQPAEQHSIEIRDVSKRFPAADSPAVDRVSLDIRRGEFFSLLGPSGCGKTTLLRMIAGFEQPTSGTILINGRDVTGTPPYQ